jgi:hypothetical protein
MSWVRSVAAGSIDRVRQSGHEWLVYPLRRWRWAGFFVILGCLILGFETLQGRGQAQIPLQGRGQAQVPARADALPAVEQPIRSPQAPRPLGSTSRFIPNLKNIAYFYFAEDQRAVLFFPGHDPLTLQGDEAEVLRNTVRLPSLPGTPQPIGRYYVNPQLVAYMRVNNQNGWTVSFVSCPSIDLTADEVAKLNRFFQPGGPVEELPPPPPPAPAAPSTSVPATPPPPVPPRPRS